MSITTPSSSLSSFSSFSLTSSPHHSLLPFTTSFPKPTKPISLSLSLSSSSKPITVPNAEPPHTDTTFFSTDDDPDFDAVFNPPSPPEGFTPPPSFDDEPSETEEQIARAYEELYGPAYSGVSVLGNDIYVMDSKVRKVSSFGKVKKEKIRDGFEERVVEVRRVTKVVKGGKQLHFRVIVVVGDKRGLVGVGVGKAKEVVDEVVKGRREWWGEEVREKEEREERDEEGVVMDTIRF